MSKRRINVTKSFIPELSTYTEYVRRAFDQQWLTNRGPLTLELESLLKKHLSLDQILLTANGTIPLQIALKIAGNNGEVITPPFSYIATTSSILWEQCTPVFVDIDPNYLTIDAAKIEEAITDKTTAILATHVFGNPCDVTKIQEIADKHGIAVIYDASHCFGVELNGNSIFNYGDISTCSFHATKLFHTGEGGAIIANNKELAHSAFYSHNFGHNGPHSFFGIGINGKMSELHAAMGLSVLPSMDKIIRDRKAIVNSYHKLLEFKNYKAMRLFPNTKWNYSYFPIVFDTEKELLEVEEKLNALNIFPRRYFYPSLNTLSFVDKQPCPTSEQIANTVLCLPLYSGLIEEEVKLICKTINN